MTAKAAAIIYHEGVSDTGIKSYLYVQQDSLSIKASLGAESQYRHKNFP